MAYIDRIKIGSSSSTLHYLLDSGALHDSSTHKLTGTTADMFSVENGTIKAKYGKFTFLEAEDLQANTATITGLLDVKGELHTNKWTNANIANVGGSFYISPTYKSNASSVSIGGSAGNRTLTISGATFGSSVTGLNWDAWSNGSTIIVTGSIVYPTTAPNTSYPLGTLKGTLGGHTDTGFTINSLADSTVLDAIASTTGVTSGYKGVDIQVSLLAIDGTKPIGILLTSYGTSQATYLDIYGGTNSNTDTPSVPNAKPNLRIGYLNGLPTFTVGGVTTVAPTGWGIYTDNGYFKGTIAADSGVIGGWTISELKLYTGSHDTYDSNDNGIYLGQGSVSNDYFVSGGPEAQWYLRSDGTGRIGELTLTKETVGSEEIFTATLPAANVTGLLKANQIDTEFITVGLDEVVSGTITYVYEPSAGNLKTVFKDNINNTYYYVEEQDNYVLTEDTTVVEGKTYYSKNGSTYTPITNPTGNPHNNNYYEVIIIEQRIPVAESQLKEENGTLVTNRADDGLGTRIQSITNITEPLQDKVNRHLIEDGSGENESLSLQVGSEVDTYLKLDGSGIKLYAKNGDNLEEIAKYGTDIILGKQDGAHIQLSNDNGLQFYNSNSDSSTAVAFINSEVLSINQAQILNTLQIGDFTWNKSVKTISNTQYERVSLVYGS